MDKYLIEALFILLVGVLPVGVAGYLIVFKGRNGLISGYSEDKFSRPHVFGKRVGLSLLVFSFLLACIAYLWYLRALTETQMSSCVAMLISALVVNYLYNLIVFRKKTTK